MSEPSNNPPKQAHHLLSATYQSPTNEPFVFTQQLPAPASTTDPKQRASYLGTLRAATAELQEQINSNLTARMEEDKAREAGTGAGTGAGNGTKATNGVDEAKEEDNYGEEVVEEDD